MNIVQVCVVDFILLIYVCGYINVEFIGQILFLIVSILICGVCVIWFGKESFCKMNICCVSGVEIVCVQYGYVFDLVVFQQDVLEGLVFWENM